MSTKCKCLNLTLATGSELIKCVHMVDICSLFQKYGWENFPVGLFRLAGGREMAFKTI